MVFPVNIKKIILDEPFFRVSRGPYVIFHFIFLSMSHHHKYYFVSIFIIIVINLLLRYFFHTNVSRWFFSGLWVTTCLFESSRLFSVFWPMLEMLFSGWSLLIHWFLHLLVTLPILWGLFQVHHLQLVPPSLSCSTLLLFSSKI